MDDQKYQGALVDTRSASEKESDRYFGEVVASATPVNWIEKPQSAWRKFPIFNQNGSGSCVAQTMVKLMGIIYWLANGIYVHFSATHLYQRRSNKPGSGMIANNAFELAQKGVTLEELVPSQSMSDKQMDAVVIPEYKQKVGEIFAIGEKVVLGAGDIDRVASVIQQTGKGVMVWFFAQNDEWTDVPSIKNGMLKLAEASIVHSITAVDFTLYQGKKALIIEDSWGPNYGKGGQRVITEDFFKTRNWYAAYPMNFKFQAGTTDEVKPTYTFGRNLIFLPWDEAKNQPSNFTQHTIQKADVVALQDILKYEGLFPKNIASTGYFGSATADAVLAFQLKYKVDTTSALTALKGRSVGPLTREKLNTLFSS